MAASLPTSVAVLPLIRRLFPSYSPSSSSSTSTSPVSSFSFRAKGNDGRIAIVGGCSSYVGAPYFASMTSLLLGADLCSVFCSHSATIPLKSFSPDLMVRGVFYEESDKDQLEKHSRDYLISTASEEVVSTLSRVQVVVLGCGLGRDPLLLAAVKRIISEARSRKLPIVLDGDALFLLAQDPLLVAGYDDCILTPNGGEFDRLWAALKLPPLAASEKTPSSAVLSSLQSLLPSNPCLVIFPQEFSAYPFILPAVRLAEAFGGLTVLQKGAVDVITNGKVAVLGFAVGSPRRIGGQGDILAGATGTFLAWSRCHPVSSFSLPAPVLAAVSASYVTRLCSRKAFQRHGRSMLASRVLDVIEEVVNEEFPIDANSTEKETEKETHIAQSKI